MGITVLLMNLLIGILSTNYDTHQGRAQILFVQARARMLLEQQRRPWSMAFAWLRRGFKNPATYSAARIKTGELEGDFGELPEQYRYPANVGIVALYPLQQVMTRDIFRHFLAGAVYGPVLQHPHLAFVILILSPLLLVLSLLVWLTFGLLCLVFRWQGATSRVADPDALLYLLTSHILLLFELTGTYRTYLLAYALACLQYVLACVLACLLACLLACYSLAYMLADPPTHWLTCLLSY